MEKNTTKIISYVIKVLAIIAMIGFIWNWRKPNYNEKNVREYIENHIGNIEYTLHKKFYNWTVILADYPNYPINIEEKVFANKQPNIFLDYVFNKTSLVWNFEKVFKPVFEDIFIKMKDSCLKKYNGTDNPKFDWKIFDVNFGITIVFDDALSLKDDYDLIKNVLNYYIDNDFPFLSFSDVDITVKYETRKTNNYGTNYSNAYYWSFGLLRDKTIYIPEYEEFEKVTKHTYDSKIDVIYGITDWISLSN